MKIAQLTSLVGVLGFVSIAASAMAADAPAPPISRLQTRTDVVRVQAELSDHMAQANATFDRYASAAQKTSALYAKLHEQTTAFRKLAVTCAKGCSAEQGAALFSATKDLEETQMSFNLQFLQLQSQMQNENRSYTALSAIMKTKHDTVKNSISNVR